MWRPLKTRITNSFIVNKLRATYLKERFSLLGRTKHIETKENIQIYWDTKWPGILQFSLGFAFRVLFHRFQTIFSRLNTWRHARRAWPWRHTLLNFFFFFGGGSNWCPKIYRKTRFPSNTGLELRSFERNKPWHTWFIYPHINPIQLLTVVARFLRALSLARHGFDTNWSLCLLLLLT